VILSGFLGLSARLLVSLHFACNVYQVFFICKTSTSSFSDFAQEFTPEGSVLFGNSIGSLCVLAAAAKAGSDLFKYVPGHESFGLRRASILGPIAHARGCCWGTEFCNILNLQLDFDDVVVDSLYDIYQNFHSGMGFLILVFTIAGVLFF
jgi:hypothetical protein